MPDHIERETQLAMLRPLLTISPQGRRGLAMLARASRLADDSIDVVDDPENTSGNLICYCLREALDSIFPKLDDPKIREVSQRLVGKWHRFATLTDADLIGALGEHLDELSRALDAATAGFLPRVSSFLGVLHPGIAADLSIPAMSNLSAINKAANAGLHGSATHRDAVELLDTLLARLVDLVAPLAVTARQYQDLIDAGDFAGIAALLATNSDPRIRVYLFDGVRDPALAEALDIAEMLPSGSTWFAYGYLRHLAEGEPTGFTNVVNRIPDALMTPHLASLLLTCVSFAGATAAPEIDRLSKLAGAHARAELVARWLLAHAGAVPTAPWWRVSTRLVAQLDTSRAARAPHGLAELIDLALSDLANTTKTARTRFRSAVFSALIRLDAESPYAITFHFDNRHLRALSTSAVLINAACHLLGDALAANESVDLTGLDDRSRATLLRAAIAPAITMATSERAATIAHQAFTEILERIIGDEWPDPEDTANLAAALPLVDTENVAQLQAAIGEPPPPPDLRRDIANVAEARADWFRLAQWAAHLPEQFRPENWIDALRESSELGTAFGPIPTSRYVAEPRANESPLGSIEIDATTVPQFVEAVNAALAVSPADDPRFAMTLRETVTRHTTEHLAAWAEDHHSIGLIQDLWVRRMVIAALKSEANEAPRLSWEQLQALWIEACSEAGSLEAAGTDSARPALSQLATEILEHLRHRVAERPRSAADINWWTTHVLSAALPMIAWVADAEPDIGMPALFSIRGETVRLLVALSSPIDQRSDRDTAVDRALDMLTSASTADSAWASSLGHWARWLIHRAPEWWRRSAGALVGAAGTHETRHAILAGNFDSTALAPDLLGVDVDFLNDFARSDHENAAYPSLAAVLWGVVPAGSIQPETWLAMFRDTTQTEHSLRFLFPGQNVPDDENAVTRFAMLRIATQDAACGERIWRSIDVLAGSPDVMDTELFAFAAELAVTNRGAPISTHHLADRFIRSLATPNAVLTLEAMCVANLGGDRAMAQFELTSVNEWFQRDGAALPADLRTRIRHALFEVGFLENGN